MAPCFKAWIPSRGETEAEGNLYFALDERGAALQRVTGNRRELSGTIVYLRLEDPFEPKKQNPIVKIRVNYGMEEVTKEDLPTETPRPIDDWHEDMGPCLWWKFPIEEPPYVGAPTWDDFPDYVTHFTRVPMPSKPWPTST